LASNSAFAPAAAWGTRPTTEGARRLAESAYKGGRGGHDLRFIEAQLQRAWRVGPDD